MENLKKNAGFWRRLSALWNDASVIYLLTKSVRVKRMAAMVIIALSFLGLSALIDGCKKDSMPAVTDTSLEPKLLGTWRSDAWAKILVFKGNHEFVDSNFYPSINSDNLTYVLHGHFAVKGEYIALDSITLNYFYKSSDSAIIDWLFYPLPLIKIRNLFWSKVEFVPTKILSPENPSNPNKLEGNWITNIPVSAFDREQNPSFVTGNDQREYIFSSDSAWFSINHILRYGNKTKDYNYGLVPYWPEDLGYTSLYGDPVLISYKNNLMYLESQPQDYVKTSYH